MRKMEVKINENDFRLYAYPPKTEYHSKYVQRELLFEIYVYFNFSVQKGIKIPVITIALKNDEVIKTLIVFRNLFQMLFYKLPNID